VDVVFGPHTLLSLDLEMISRPHHGTKPSVDVVVFRKIEKFDLPAEPVLDGADRVRFNHGRCSKYCRFCCGSLGIYPWLKKSAARLMTCLAEVAFTLVRKRRT